MLNTIMIQGNLTRAPEFRFLQKSNIALAKITICNNKYFNNSNNEKTQKTCFIECELWGRLAEIANQYLQKGDKVSLVGELCHSVWQDESTGQMRSKHYIKVNELDLPAKKGQTPAQIPAQELSNNAENYVDMPQQQQEQPQPQAQNFDNLRPGDNWDKAIIDDNFPSDDEIPF